MFCVNPENGYLAVKQLASDGSCQFTSLYSASDLASLNDQLTYLDGAALIGAAFGCYAVTFVIKLVLQQLGYRP